MTNINPYETLAKVQDSISTYDQLIAEYEALMREGVYPADIEEYRLRRARLVEGERELSRLLGL